MLYHNAPGAYFLLERDEANQRLLQPRLTSAVALLERNEHNGIETAVLRLIVDRETAVSSSEFLVSSWETAVFLLTYNYLRITTS